MLQGNFHFDENGNLKPNIPVETDLEALARFVSTFPPEDRRHWIFENYLQYLENFQTQVFPWFEQWVDGSFVSMKKNPKDIDVVTFLDYRVFEMRGEAKLDQFLGSAVDSQGIDAYIVKVYPEKHEKYDRFLFDQSQWNRRFSQSRVIQPKGYLKLVFQNLET